MTYDPTLPATDADWRPPTTPDEIEAATVHDQQLIRDRLAPPPEVEPEPEVAKVVVEDAFKIDGKTDVYAIDGTDGYVVQRRIDGRREWVQMGRGKLATNLARAGHSRQMMKGEFYSPAEDVTTYADTFNRISGCGAVAGYQPGLAEFPGGRYAVTSGFSLPEPGDPDPYLGGVIQGMVMGDEDVYDVFLGWLRRFYVSLRDGVDSPGQILALLGPPGTGKTWLIEKVIARMFGGRVAKPFPFFSGETRFNDDIVGAELLVIDDEQGAGDRRTRKTIATRVKQAIGSATVRVEAKGKAPVTVCPRWRIVYGANDEADAMKVFPEDTSDMRDKVCFIEIPENIVFDFPGRVLPRGEFDDKVDAAFGGFVREVIDHVLPDDLTDARWGVKSLRGPKAVQEMDAKDSVYNRSDDERLEDMLKILVGVAVEDEVEYTAAGLIDELAKNAATRDGAKHVTAGCPRRTGLLLGKIRDRSGVVRASRSGGVRTWLVSFDGEDGGDFDPLD